MSLRALALDVVARTRVFEAPCESRAAGRWGGLLHTTSEITSTSTRREPRDDDMIARSEDQVRLRLYLLYCKKKTRNKNLQIENKNNNGGKIMEPKKKRNRTAVSISCAMADPASLHRWVISPSLPHPYVGHRPPSVVFPYMGVPGV